MKQLTDIADIVAIAPEQPRSAAGLSITVHKPLRVNKVLSSDNVELYTVTGTTGDCVTIGIFYVLEKYPDLIVSGINVGENISLLEFFMSGTVAGAILGAIHGIPSIAFSKREVGRDVLFTEDIKTPYQEVARCAKIITSYVLDEGLPKGVDLLNVNFPDRIRANTKVRITRLAKLSLRSRVIVRKDPRGRPYYWIWGDKFTSFPRGTDAHEIVDMGNISITPIILSNLAYRNIRTIRFQEMEKYLNQEIMEVIR
jgi:5'-nucleotidase